MLVDTLGCESGAAGLADAVARIPRLDSLDDQRLMPTIRSLGLPCSGIGAADARIMAIAISAGALVPTSDRSMQRESERLGIAFLR